jgi:hypothetical protein
MVFMENVGDNDFGSVYDSVGEQVREEEERQQAEMFLRLLDDLDARATGDTTSPDVSDNDSEYGYSDDEEEYRRQRMKKRRGRSRGTRRPNLHKEYMKVSITDDEKNKREQKKEDEHKRRDFYGKVHTLDDLPPDEMDFYKIFGGAPPEELPEVNIQGGRRLRDGKIVYSASFPGMFLDGLDIGSFSLDMEYVLLFIVVVLLVGIFVGKMSSGNKHRREIQQLKKTHMNQLNSIQQNIIASSKSSAQPVYIPVPMPQMAPQARAQTQSDN